MGEPSLSAILEREHREIDEGLAAFVTGLKGGAADRVPLRRADAALRRHIYIEEEFLFPPLRAAGLMAPLFVMVREHGEIWRALGVLESSLEAEAASEQTLAACAELAALLDRHNEKEEPIIYPQADTALTAEDAGRMRVLLATGTLPAGWVCQAARV